MKFSHSLKFNAVPEWQDSYLNYPTLKKTVYKLQQDQLVNNGTDDQGYTVNANQTTVSELVDNFKLKNPISIPQEGSSSDHSESNKDGNALKHRLAKNIFNKFKKNKNNSDSDIEIQEFSHNDDLEKKPVTVTSVDDYSDKNSEIKSFTGDVDNSSTGSSSNTNSPDKVIHRILEKNNDDEFSDPKSLSFDPLKVFGKQLLSELEKINDFYNVKEKEIFKNYDNLLKDLHNKNVDIDDVFRFTQAYYSDPDAIYTDSHHQYHITSTLSRTVTNGSVFDTINHIDNDYDQQLQKQRSRSASQSYHDLEKQEGPEVYVNEEDSEDDDEEEIGASQDSVLLHHSDFNVKQQLKVTLKRRAITLFISLSELKSFIELNSHASIHDNWTDLYPGENSFKITKCVGNLLKTVDNKPAAKLLEDNDKLMSIGSKETEVYVKIKKPNSNTVERFKVIAGGGGWGAKADIIALSPEAKLENGSEIQFYMVTPEDRYLNRHDDGNVDKYVNSFTFTNSYEQTGYEDHQSEEQKVYENVFGCGSEHGFFFNGIKHNSPGESITLKLGGSKEKKI